VYNYSRHLCGHDIYVKGEGWRGRGRGRWGGGRRGARPGDGDKDILVGGMEGF